MWTHLGWMNTPYELTTTHQIRRKSLVGMTPKIHFLNAHTSRNTERDQDYRHDLKKTLRPTHSHTYIHRFWSESEIQGAENWKNLPLRVLCDCMFCILALWLGIWTREHGMTAPFNGVLFLWLKLLLFYPCVILSLEGIQVWILGTSINSVIQICSTNLLVDGDLVVSCRDTGFFHAQEGQQWSWLFCRACSASVQDGFERGFDLSGFIFSVVKIRDAENKTLVESPRHILHKLGNDKEEKKTPPNFLIYAQSLSTRFWDPSRRMHSRQCFILTWPGTN